MAEEVVPDADGVEDDDDSLLVELFELLDELLELSPPVLLLLVPRESVR